MKMAPIVVLTYGFCGERRLRFLLERADHEVFCTKGTGIIPACGAALRAWQGAEGSSVTGEASPLAVRSVRAMVDGMIAVIAARYGGRVWCETATADPRTVESFLTVVPETRVICLYRSCEDFVYTVLNDSPWGVDEPQFAASVSAHPYSSVAAISSWWVARSKSFLEFESKRQDRCFRVRFEDLALKEDSVAAMLSEWLDFPGKFGPAQGWTGDDSFSPTDRPPGCGAGFPVDQLPRVLAEEIDSIQLKLGYSPLLQVRSDLVR